MISLNTPLLPTKESYPHKLKGFVGAVPPGSSIFQLTFLKPSWGQFVSSGASPRGSIDVYAKMPPSKNSTVEKGSETCLTTRERERFYYTVCHSRRGLRHPGAWVFICPGKLTVADSFRIGCIGDLGEKEMRAALTAIREIIDEMGITHCGPKQSEAATA